MSVLEYDPKDALKDKSQDEFRPNWQLKSIFGVVGLLNFVATLDATSLSVALPV